MRHKNRETTQVFKRNHRKTAIESNCQSICESLSLMKSSFTYSWGPPRGFREQGNMAIYFWGTRDILKLLLGNRGTFELYSGTREHWLPRFLKKKNCTSLGPKMSEEGHSFLFFLVVQEERDTEGTVLSFTKELVTSFWASGNHCGNLGKF